MPYYHIQIVREDGWMTKLTDTLTFLLAWRTCWRSYEPPEQPKDQAVRHT